MYLDQINIVEGDITRMETEAIVNAANKTLLGGGGVDGAIHRAAGPNLLEACKKLDGCETGQAKITPGFKLKARYVIHTVGPVWSSDHEKCDELLKSAYMESLKLAEKEGLKSIAFPSISTGVYGFPFERACRIALTTVLDFESESLGKVYFVTFGERDYQAMKQVFQEMQN